MTSSPCRGGRGRRRGDDDADDRDHRHQRCPGEIALSNATVGSGIADVGTGARRRRIRKAMPSPGRSSPPDGRCSPSRAISPRRQRRSARMRPGRRLRDRRLRRLDRHDDRRHGRRAGDRHPHGGERSGGDAGNGRLRVRCAASTRTRGPAHGKAGHDVLPSTATALTGSTIAAFTASTRCRSSPARPTER